MHNAIAHCSLTDVQPVSEQQQPLQTPPTVLLFSVMSHGMGHCFGLSGVSCLGSVPSQLLLQPHLPYWQDSMRRQNILDLVQALLSNNISVLSTVFSC